MRSSFKNFQKNEKNQNELPHSLSSIRTYSQPHSVNRYPSLNNRFTYGQDQFFSFLGASWSLLISASLGFKNSVSGLRGAGVSFLSFSSSALLEDSFDFSAEFVVVVEPKEPKLDFALADPNAKSPADAGAGFSSVEPLPFPLKDISKVHYYQ